MPFQKGQSGNPKGRTPGKMNKDTGSLRKRIAALLDDNYAKIVKDMEKLEPRDRVNAWLKLLEYAIPKLRQDTIIDVSKLSDQEVDELLITAANALSDGQTNEE